VQPGRLTGGGRAAATGHRRCGSGRAAGGGAGDFDDGEFVGAGGLGGDREESPSTRQLLVIGPQVPFATSAGIRTVAGGTATPGADFVPIDLPLTQLTFNGFSHTSIPL